MRFAAPLVAGRLVRREKRFLVHVALDDGRSVIAHTNNTGSMRGCFTPGDRVWLSPAPDPHRKLPWTVEIIAAGRPQVRIGVNTIHANKLVREGIQNGLITKLQGYADIRAEVACETGPSRLDFLLTPAAGTSSPTRAWVEVKSVTYVEGDTALFPDAVTARGRKHLRDLTALAATGQRAVLIFVVQRADAVRVSPADAIDPAYGEALRRAQEAGVEILAYQAQVTLRRIELKKRLPVVL